MLQKLQVQVFLFQRLTITICIIFGISQVPLCLFDKLTGSMENDEPVLTAALPYILTYLSRYYIICEIATFVMPGPSH